MVSIAMHAEAVTRTQPTRGFGLMRRIILGVRHVTVRTAQRSIAGVDAFSRTRLRLVVARKVLEESGRRRHDDASSVDVDLGNDRADEGDEDLAVSGGP